MSRANMLRSVVLSTDDVLINDLLELARLEDEDEHDHTAALMREAAARLSGAKAIVAGVADMMERDLHEYELDAYFWHTIAPIVREDQRARAERRKNVA